MFIPENGDTVRIGGGKVEYVILETNGNKCTVESMNTGKAQEVETSRLKLVEKGKSDDNKGGSETGGNACKDVDGRETPYGLMILMALMRKPYVHLAVNNPMKPSNRKRNRARIKRERTTWHTRNAMANRAA
jgi:hypothetical protein